MAQRAPVTSGRGEAAVSGWPVVLLAGLFLLVACGRSVTPGVAGQAEPCPPEGPAAADCQGEDTPRVERPGPQQVACPAGWEAIAGECIPPPADPQVFAVGATSPLSGWAVVGPWRDPYPDRLMAVRTGDGGVTWQEVRPAQLSDGYVSDVRFEDPLRGWLVAVAASTSQAGPGEPGLTVLAVFRTEDAGATWQGPVRIEADVADGMAVLSPVGDGRVDVLVSGNRWRQDGRLYRVDAAGGVRASSGPVPGGVIASLGEVVVLRGGGLPGSVPRELYISVDGGQHFAPVVPPQGGPDTPVVEVPGPQDRRALRFPPGVPLPEGILASSGPQLGQPTVAPWGIRVPLAVEFADPDRPLEVGFLYADLPHDGQLPTFGYVLTPVSSWLLASVHGSPIAATAAWAPPSTMLFPEPDLAVRVGDPLLRFTRTPDGWQPAQVDTLDDLRYTTAAAAAPTVWWAALRHDPRVWASTDRGMTWTALPTPPGRP